MAVKKIRLNEDFESDFSQIVGRNVNTEIIEECLDIISEAFKDYDTIEEFYFDGISNDLYFTASNAIDGPNCYIEVSYLKSYDELVFDFKDRPYLSFTSEVISKIHNSINLNITPESLNNTFNRLKKTLRSLNLKDNIDLIDFMYYNY
jgi:hypothetical protein